MAVENSTYVMFCFLFVIAEHGLENAAVEIAIFKELMWPSVLLCRVETSCDVDPRFPKLMASQWMKFGRGSMDVSMCVVLKGVSQPPKPLPSLLDSKMMP